MRRRKIPKNSLPMLPGTVVARYHKCGRANCHCTHSGTLHGPYYRRQWYARGRLRSAYVRQRDVERVRKACEAWRRAQREARETERAIEELYRHEFAEMRAQLRRIAEEYGWKG